MIGGKAIVIDPLRIGRQPYGTGPRSRHSRKERIQGVVQRAYASIRLELRDVPDQVQDAARGWRSLCESALIENRLYTML